MEAAVKDIIRLIIICLIMSTVSCSKLAEITTPSKEPKYSQTQLSNAAEAQFWQTLHQGNYQEIPHVLHLLMAAYWQNPHDPKIAAHIGFTQMWAIAERSRLATADPRSIEHIVVARRFFEDAVQLDPTDARFLGFLGDATLVEGNIMQNEREQVRGYFILKQAIHDWPEFNLFTAGYPMSILPYQSEHFQEALGWQWKTLDICTGHHVDRSNPTYAPYMNVPLTRPSQRACWNSWIAPHNFEGFFLNMGDMLVKNGDWRTAIIIYKNAQLSRDYHSWPYRNILEQRIINAQANVERFRQSVNLAEIQKEPTMMFNSTYSCMACHQEGIYKTINR